MEALRIGITCFPSTGGSGVVATEIGLGMAERGHQVHLICAEAPARLSAQRAADAAEKNDHGHSNLHFHRVALPDYPLPYLSAYPLALAGQLAELSAELGLELLHLHYSIPHAASAVLCQEMLKAAGRAPPRVVTTLHGTDVTLVGSAPELLPVNRFSLLRCDGITTPSAFLREAAYAQLGLPRTLPIAVIPNFVDVERFKPAPDARARRRGTADSPYVLCHSSNFRALKRIDVVVAVFAEVRKHVHARLVLIGDGPERPRIEALLRELGLADSVAIAGLISEVEGVLADSDVFLLPSDTEGFGLAALEAESCGVPVVASRVGGLPEVVVDGETGRLCEPLDIAGMAAAVRELLLDRELYARQSQAARAWAESRWGRAPRLVEYEAYYRSLLATG